MLRKRTFNTILRRSSSSSSSSSLSSLSSLSSSITIFGDIKVTNNTNINSSSLIPSSQLLKGCHQPSEINHHLRWLAQKYNMRQDCCLIGHPTSLRRNIILKFAEEVGLEVEFLSITRDTVSSDLTQRREIFGSSILFVDQAVVRAAKYGRVLVLDGLEKAERNVLPTLNNLLENREMNLDDGTMLISNKSYDQITKNGMKSTKLIPVSENFFVVSLVSPSPPYISSTSMNIDPPLRSRFQCRYIDELKTDTLVSMFQQYPIDDRFKKVMSLYETLSTLRNNSLNDDNDNSLSLLPIFSLRNVYNTMNIIKQENISVEKAIQKSILPLQLISTYLPSTYKTRIEQIYENYNLNNYDNLSTNENASTTLFPEQVRILSDLRLDCKLGIHMLVIGDRGIGKSILADVFSKEFKGGYHFFQMYSELSGRDLLQRRVTDDQGNSQWLDSPLTTGIRSGDLVVLDGFDRLEVSCLSILKRIMNDHTIELPNGERIKSHQNFRLLALSLPPKSASDFRDRYLQSDLPFSINYMDTSKMIEDKLQQLSSSSSSLYKIAKAFTKSDSEFKLSLKNITILERMLQRQSKIGNTDSNGFMTMLGISSNTSTDSFLIDKVEDMLMIKYLPSSSQKKFAGIVESLNLVLPAKSTSSKESKTKKSSSSSSTSNIHPEIIDSGKYVSIDNLKVMRSATPENPEKIPHPLYFNNVTHSKLLKELILNTFHDGQKESIIIIGNQGTGKNKIVDQMLHLLNIEKEYVQLHRDSTIQSLTVLPTLIDGKIIFEDSPLVKAVKYGRCMVVDEVDKASVEVLFILKALAEQQNLYLGDGRKVISRPNSMEKNENDIVVHDGFRLVLLANPGVYPFHGNEFFKHCGDSFLPFVLDELDLGSEVELLKSFGPSVDVKTIADIALTFFDLRNEYSNGSISYPFSTRESVSIIKHLEAYKADGISSAIENVISFDSMTPSLKNLILSKFKERGIPISKDHEEKLMQWEIIKQRSMMNKSDPRTDIGSPKHGKVDPNNKPHVGGNTWAGGSGGSDTSGLGGRSGPYRNDSGHDVHQVSDEAKNAVSQEIKDEAARLAKEGLLKRLQEIKMQKFEYNAYMMFKKRIENEVQQLREILTKNKNNERSWLRNQPQGEIDDNKLVDGILGEKNIYKKRSPPDSPENRRFNKENITSNNKKKRFHFVVDVSASMYRFNGMDHRLERMIEVVLLIMEAIPPDSELYDYAITGHSGDSSSIKFIDWGKEKPMNEKDRFEILQSMIAHSQYCLAGDHTLKATSRGISNLKKVLGSDNDIEGYNFIFSDANFDRYDISVSEIKKSMISQDDRINSFLLLIASLEEEANKIVKALPVGSAHTCFNSNDLPGVVKKILLETLK